LARTKSTETTDRKLLERSKVVRACRSQGIRSSHRVCSAEGSFPSVPPPKPNKLLVASRCTTVFVTSSPTPNTNPCMNLASSMGLSHVGPFPREEESRASTSK
ncbi:unnamed protein product, partial [Laminaria digitata]